MAETDWVSAHLFHSGNLDHLLNELVRPLVAELCDGAAAAGWFFLRYWDGGPHVRLRVLPGRGAGPAAVRERIAEAAAAYFAAHPSGQSTPPEAYAEAAAELARREGMTDYARELVPTDSLVFIPYRREHDRYGVGASMAAVERHFETSSRIALDLLDAGPTADQRSTVAFSFILLTWLCRDAAGPVRAWTAGPGGGGAGPEPADVDLDERFARQRDALLAIGGRVRALVSAARPVAPAPTLDWLRSVRDLRDVLTAEAAAGRFPAGDRPAGDRPAPARPADASAQVRHVLDLCAHLFCNRLGVSVAAEEPYLRGLAARTLAALADGSAP